MDLLIPDSWLRKFLDTKATPKEIAKYLTLSGPSVEKIVKSKDNDSVYSIEITTNRVDSASVLGIAREGSAILPRFGISARLKNLKLKDDNYSFVEKVKYLDVKVDNKLCPRFTAVLIKDVTIKESPKDIQNKLTKVDVRPINNIVDVSNFIMHEFGQPVHTFDYDKIKDKRMILRESKKDELITTLDGKTFKLDGWDIVIEDGSKKLIDLCGIMGGENSAIDEATKNVLLFVQIYNPQKIRNTSMKLNQRSEAATLFEKGLDFEQIKPAIVSAIQMIEKLSLGKAEKEILDINSLTYKVKTVSTTKDTLDRIIGISIPYSDITKYLESLGFKVSWNKNNIDVNVPSWRQNDINIPEDIAEEIARIYGYHNLPSIMLSGQLPKPRKNDIFKFESNLKQILKFLGGVEVYNLSLTSTGSIKLKNPLGTDTEYLRTNLKDSLISDIENNSHEKEYIHMFEIANTYLPRKDDLPEERLTLAGIIKNANNDINFCYRENRGIVDTIFNELSIDHKEKIEDGLGYLPNQKLIIYSDNNIVGEYGNLENGLFFYKFDLEKLMNSKKIIHKYKDVPKYPPQVEDMTFQIPEKTYIGEVIQLIKSISNLITKVELINTFKDNYTFNIEYQNPNKTLTDQEVKEIRNKILIKLKEKFGISIKE